VEDGNVDGIKLILKNELKSFKLDNEDLKMVKEKIIE